MIKGKQPSSTARGAVLKNGPGRGRKKGSPNKVTKSLKDMILGALDAAGGQQYLMDQAILNPNAFLTLIGKVLPSDMRVQAVDSLEELVIKKRDGTA